MTRARRILAAAGVVTALGGRHRLRQPTPRTRRASRERTRAASATRSSGGGWYCTVPTPGRPARVHVTAFENGSARVVALDPDAEITGGK